MPVVSKCGLCVRSSGRHLVIYRIDVGLLQCLLELVSQIYLNCRYLELDVCAEILTQFGF